MKLPPKSFIQIFILGCCFQGILGFVLVLSNARDPSRHALVRQYQITKFEVEQRSLIKFWKLYGIWLIT